MSWRPHKCIVHAWVQILDHGETNCPNVTHRNFTYFPPELMLWKRHPTLSLTCHASGTPWKRAEYHYIGHHRTVGRMELRNCPIKDLDYFNFIFNIMVTFSTESLKC